MSTTARVTELYTYPVKSMDGAPHRSVEVGPTGLVGDRAWSVVRPDGQVVSARQWPGLPAVQVSLDAGGGPVLDIPEVGHSVAGSEADAALSSYLGSPVRLVPAAASPPGAAAVHLVSRQAVVAATGTSSADPACDIEAPRANLMIDLGDDPPADFERAWVGQHLEIGDVVLLVDRVPKHCLGVYAEVLTPGRINLGDSVRARG